MIWIIFILYFSEAIIYNNAFVVVIECPVSRTLWDWRVRNTSCGKGTFYHCLRATNNSLIEGCFPLKVLKAENGCPFAQIYRKTVYITQRQCHSTIKGCPMRHEGDFISNSILNYSACLLYTYDEILTGRIDDDGSTTFTYTATDYRTYITSRNQDHTTSSSFEATYGSTVQRSNINFKNSSQASELSKGLTVLKSTVSQATIYVNINPSFNSSMIIAVALGTLVLILLFIFCVVVYIQRMKNERYRIRFERIQYLPSIQNNIDQLHTYGDIDIYDEVLDTDANNALFETKDEDSENIQQESDKSIENEHEDYDDFIDIQESSNSDSSYLKPKNKSYCENGSEMENELPMDITVLDSNEHSRDSSESVISAEYVEPNPFIP